MEIVKNFLKEKNWEECISYLRNIQKLKQEEFFFVMAYYKSFNGLKKYDLAEVYIDKALTLTTTNSTLWRDKGLCYQRRLELDKAKKCLSNAINLNPNIASYYASRGSINYLKDDILNAIKDYNYALKLNPKQISWLKTLANILVKNRMLEEGIKVYSELLSLDDSIHNNTMHKELKKQLLSGSLEASNQYYDVVFTNSEKYLDSGESSIYIEIWKYIVFKIQEKNYIKILDLGCGPGQFATFLENRIANLEYVGVDFSHEAIKIARKKIQYFPL